MTLVNIKLDGRMVLERSKKFIIAQRTPSSYSDVEEGRRQNVFQKKANAIDASAVINSNCL